jgi:hypothetical protein
MSSNNNIFSWRTGSNNLSPLEVTIMFNESFQEKALKMEVFLLLWKLCGIASWRTGGSNSIVAMEIIG